MLHSDISFNIPCCELSTRQYNLTGQSASCMCATDRHVVGLTTFYSILLVNTSLKDLGKSLGLKDTRWQFVKIATIRKCISLENHLKLKEHAGVSVTTDKNFRISFYILQLSKL